MLEPKLAGAGSQRLPRPLRTKRAYNMHRSAWETVHQGVLLPWLTFADENRALLSA